MKNDKKIIKIIISVLLVFVICIFGISILKSYFSSNSYAKVLSLNWNIKLPEEGEILYDYSEPSPHGDGIRYHVIDYSDADTKQTQNNIFLLDNIFVGAKQPTNEQIERANQLLSQIDVVDKYIPEFNNCLLIYRKQEDNSELFLFYCRDKATLYILESFI